MGERALLKADVDLRVIFYDLTAFTVHGYYAKSDAVDFGFAYHTPMGKRKVGPERHRRRESPLVI